MKYVILVADDEAEIRDLLRLYLENSGYDVLEAADGLEALAILEKKHVDLAVLDVMMPGLNGLHVLKKLRETSNIPVLVFSAKDTDADKILGLNLGADVYTDMEDAGMEYDVDIPEEAGFAEVDKAQFTRAMNNLITNAVKHNSPGTKIEIRMKREFGSWIIKVMDSGEKIEEALVEHLFDPFVMGDESRNSRSGSGLGLSVSKKVIDMHGGRLWLEQPTESEYTKAFCVRIREMDEGAYAYDES